MGDVQRRLMRAAMAVNIWLYRTSGGRVMGKVRGLPILLLTVAGRKTGVAHTSPVSYIEDGGRYVVTGSAGGAPAEPQWFRDLRHADQAVVEIGSRRIEVAVTIAEPADRARLWGQLVARASFFDGYQTKTGREIPMAVLTPTTGQPA